MLWNELLEHQQGAGIIGGVPYPSMDLSSA